LTGTPPDPRRDAVFLLDPDDPGENWKARKRFGGRKSPSGPGGRLGAKPPETGVWGRAPETEQVLMIIKTFLAEIFLIKSYTCA